jgi:hypothetical protein
MSTDSAETNIFRYNEVDQYRWVSRRGNRVVYLQFLPTGNTHLWLLGKGRREFSCNGCGRVIPVGTYRFAPAQGNNVNHRMHERCVNQLEREAKNAKE